MPSCLKSASSLINCLFPLVHLCIFSLITSHRGFSNIYISTSCEEVIFVIWDINIFNYFKVYINYVRIILKWIKVLECILLLSHAWIRKINQQAKYWLIMKSHSLLPHLPHPPCPLLESIIFSSFTFSFMYLYLHSKLHALKKFF